MKIIALRDCSFLRYLSLITKIHLLIGRFNRQSGVFNAGKRSFV